MNNGKVRIPQDRIDPHYFIMLKEVKMELRRVQEENASLRRQLNQAEERATSDYQLIQQLRAREGV